MNKTELIAAMAAMSELTKKEAGAALASLIDSITDALKAGERMNYYLTTLQSSAAQYAPEQLELLKQGYIYTKDNYSVMYVGATPDNVKKELAKLLH